MVYRIREALAGKHAHYQQPFFKVSERDTEESLRERLGELREHGIYSVVLEYMRTDKPPFATLRFDDIWWERLQYITKICAELGMTFWMQDAAPFPTGSANGWFEEEEHRTKSKKFIAERHTDLRGPVRDAHIPVGRLLGSMQGNVLEALTQESDMPNRLLHVIAVRQRGDGPSYDADTALDLTARVKDGVLRADLGPGNWRIFVLFETYSGGRKHFMNLLDEESVRVQIDAVHAPHYERLKDELGKTWNGFFYDEPELGNLHGYVFDHLPGKPHNGLSAPLPWSKDVPGLLERRLGADYASLLPCLWYDCTGMTPIVRHAYMDTITELVAKNYNGQIYQWCEERGITYIGHVLEDENSHARLGCGPGHFFRVMEGQHMAGIDVVGGQIWPGLDYKGMSWYGALDGDGEFYHYGLAKLGSSAAHIDPKKRGRSVCELLGLYGHIAGTRIRKFVIDHLLVNGINHFIPAQAGLEVGVMFSRKMNEYTDRMCHILQDGVHVAPAAILYHADAEWSGGFQYFHQPGKVLAQHQIDYDVVPKDVFIDRSYYGTRLEDGKLRVNQETYGAFIIPYSQRIPRAIAAFIEEAVLEGFPVIFVDRHPEGYCESMEELPQAVYECPAVPLGELAEELRKRGIYEIQTADYQPYLRYLHLRRGELDIYMFHNEEPFEEMDTVVSIPTTKPARIYDAMENRLLVPETEVIDGWTKIPLKLGQYESLVLLFGHDLGDGEAAAVLREEELAAEWSVSFESLDGRCAPEPLVADMLFDIGASDRYPDFYGRITYRTSFPIEGELPSSLSLGRVAECAEVYVNGVYLGAAVAEPYRFDLGSAVRAGRNQLEVIVTNNMTRSSNSQLNDSAVSLMASTYASLEPCGLLGPVRLIWSA